MDFSQNKYSEEDDEDAGNVVTPVAAMDEIDEIDTSAPESNDVFTAYLAEGGREGEDREPVYSPELGLCIEKLKDGFTLESLWQVLPPEVKKPGQE